MAPSPHRDGGGALDGTRITPLGDDDETAVLEYVVAAQADPTRHVTYVGDDPVAVRGDLEAAADWRRSTLVARDAAGRVGGVLVVDVDHDRGRGWWLGPWADDDATGRALLTAAAPLVAGITELEFSPDTRNTWLADLARDLGYRAEEPSAVLGLDLTTWEDTSDTVGVRPLDDDDRGLVAALHDSVFPGTHTPGRRLVDDDGTTVLVIGEPPVGYVATQIQADGSCYVDYLGVARDARRRRVGRTLLAAALGHAADAGVGEAFLTVRVGNAAARRLYASLGFLEERQAVPLRLGFSVDAPH